MIPLVLQQTDQNFELHTGTVAQCLTVYFPLQFCNISFTFFQHFNQHFISDRKGGGRGGVGLIETGRGLLI